MMLAAIGREFSRQLSEYKQFKVNLLFANLGIFFLVTGFLNYFDSQQDTFELFILLFTWYFSSHSITHPTYFIEDEIADRTIINVIQSRRSIFGMLFIKIIVQILLDLVKAIPLFCLVALVQQIAFPTDWVDTFVTFFCPLWLLRPFMVWAFSLPVFPLSLQKFPVLLASLLTGFSFWLVLRNNRVI
ncbi:MAG: ABC transporter [Streptococcus sp.]